MDSHTSRHSSTEGIHRHCMHFWFLHSNMIYRCNPIIEDLLSACQKKQTVYLIPICVWREVTYNAGVTVTQPSQVKQLKYVFHYDPAACATVFHTKVFDDCKEGLYYSAHCNWRGIWFILGPVFLCLPNLRELLWTDARRSVSSMIIHTPTHRITIFARNLVFTE